MEGQNILKKFQINLNKGRIIEREWNNKRNQEEEISTCDEVKNIIEK